METSNFIGHSVIQSLPPYHRYQPVNSSIIPGFSPNHASALISFCLVPLQLLQHLFGDCRVLKSKCRTTRQHRSTACHRRLQSSLRHATYFTPDRLLLFFFVLAVNFIPSCKSSLSLTNKHATENCHQCRPTT